MKIYLSGSVCVFCDASYHLTDYRVSVTGSSQGLGRALLDVVLASGLRAVATLRNPDVLSEYTQKYSQDKLLVTRLDVSEPTRISEVFKEVHEHFGRIDVVVNNAGYSIEGEIEATPESEARKLFEVDFWGTVNVSKEVCDRKFWRSARSSFAYLIGCMFHEGHQSAGHGRADSEYELHRRIQCDSCFWLLLCGQVR